MKRFGFVAVVALFASAALVAFAEDAAKPAEESKPTSFEQDFTKGMGRWQTSKVESKQDAEGLHITKVTEELGGIYIDDKPAQDMSAYKTVDVEFNNESGKDLNVVMKIKSNQGKQNRTDKEVTVPQGVKTVSFTLAGGDIELASVDYMRFWFAETGDVKVTIKKISLAPAAKETK
jgi:opacity protein-like surface antigen